MGIIKAGKVRNTLSLIIGIMVIIIGIIPIAGGTAILFFNRSADPGGYHWSNTYKVRTSTYAFTFKIQSLSNISFYSRIGTDLFGANNAVQAKWMITPVDSSRDLLVGLSTASQGITYVSHMETEGAVWSMGGPFKPAINVTSLLISGKGLDESTKPALTDNIWLEASLGRGPSNIDYSPVWNNRDNDKYLIIMNADGTKDVEANIKLGFNMPVFRWLPYRLIPLGFLICVGGILLAIRKK